MKKNLDNKFLVGIFMNLSKAFDCIPHLLIAKLATYGFKGIALKNTFIHI